MNTSEYFDQELGYAEDDTVGGYDWQCARVYTKEGKFYIGTESGCSCNGPGEWAPDTVCGPAATLGGLFDELYVDRAKHPIYVKDAFLDALKKVHMDTMEKAKKALAEP